MVKKILKFFGIIVGDGETQFSGNDLLTQARIAAADDLSLARGNRDLWARAVQFLKTELAVDADEIRAAIATDPLDHGWVAPYHFFWGMAVRNALRQHGFGEDEFGVQNLDNIYVELVEEAMQ